MNPQKLAGQCAKLKCCLNYEVDCYVEAQKRLPSREIELETKDGTFYFFKADILSNQVSYSTDKNFPAENRRSERGSNQERPQGQERSNQERPQQQDRQREQQGQERQERRPNHERPSRPERNQNQEKQSTNEKPTQE